MRSSSPTAASRTAETSRRSSAARRVAVTDPVYPVYVDTNVMAGRSGAAGADGRYADIVYLPATAANGFAPEPPEAPVDVAYLCSPNNPTGAVASREHLETWVASARERDAVLIFDAAYDAFIQDPALPHSICRSLARRAAPSRCAASPARRLHGVRCAYSVVPKALAGRGPGGERVALNGLWARRHATKFDSVPYPVQRAAAAVFSAQGQKQTGEQVAYYMANARALREGLGAAGFACHGGVHAPYVWVETPGGLSSWDCFDKLLGEAHVVCTPGAASAPRRGLRATLGLQRARERGRGHRAHPGGVRRVGIRGSTEEIPGPRRIRGAPRAHLASPPPRMRCGPAASRRIMASSPQCRSRGVVLARSPDTQSGAVSDAALRSRPRLLDRVRIALRLRHYSIRTEEAYVGWIRRFILFHERRHPDAMGAPEVVAFLFTSPPRARSARPRRTRR